MGGFAAAFDLVAAGFSATMGTDGSGILSWFLVAIFAVSGTVKVRRPWLAAMALVDFQIVRRPAPALGLALGAFELLVALGLALVPAVAIFVAAPLLWFFTLLIARGLRNNEDFACFCFGESDGALSRWTLARTAALALLATVVAFGSPHIWRWAAGEPWLELVAGASLFGIVVLLRQLPPLLLWNRGIFDPPVGADA
ncbi:MAG: MauE/DoxX family redox-associated membrane protein [Thermomicrobiales bacterium]